MKVQDIETHDLQVIHPECSLIEAAQLMKYYNIGALPVCDEGKLVGMVTDRDITVRGIAEGSNPHLTKVGQIMSRSVFYCYEDQEVDQIARFMEQKQIRRLPVLDRSQRLAGIVSLGDVAVRTRDERLAGEILEHVSEKNEEHATHA